jgi:hypothetical protein
MSKKSHPGDGTKGKGVKGDRVEFKRLFEVSNKRKDGDSGNHKGLDVTKPS